MKAIITRNDQTAVLELPTSRMELAGSLNQIGVRTPAHIIPCSDEEEDYIKVKFFGESDFENELTALATPKDSLGSVNTIDWSKPRALSSHFIHLVSEKPFFRVSHKQVST